MCVRAKVHGATSAKENHTQYCTCRVALQLGIGRFWSKKRLSTWPRPRPDISSLYVNSGWLPWKCHGAVTHGERVNGHAWEKIDLLCLSKLFIENALEVKRCMIEPTAYVRRELLRDAAKTPSNGIKPSLLICHSKVLLRFFFFFFLHHLIVPHLENRCLPSLFNVQPGAAERASCRIRVRKATQ